MVVLVATLERFDTLDLRVAYETFWRLDPAGGPLDLDWSSGGQKG